MFGPGKHGIFGLTGNVCQYIAGDAIDDQVVAWFFEAISSAQVDAAGGILLSADEDHSKVLRARQQQVDRLR